MSNLIRYVLYRDADRQYKFASVDRLLRPEDHKRVYVHRNHSFHIGDVCDLEFMTRVVNIEQPDIIVNAVGPDHSPLNDGMRNVVNAALTLKHLAHPAKVIQIRPDSALCPGDTSRAGWNYIGRMAVGNGGIELSLPRCFGMRDQHGQVAGMLRVLLSTEDHKSGPTFPKEKGDWAYAEDVASMIWFLIEKRAEGSFTMPSIGCASPYQIARIIDDTLDLNMYPPSEHCSTKVDSTYPEGWEPDSDSLEQALTKTVKWFHMNRWALER